MNGRELIAIGAMLIVLATMFVACHTVQARRRTPFPAPVKVPTPTPPSTRDSDDDVRLVRRLFATWRKYVWGQGSEPNDVVVYARRDAENRWRVFVLSQATPHASAYVTLPDESRPLNPDRVSWFYQSHPDTTAYALINVTADSYSAAPVDLPQNCRPPASVPRVTFIPNGSTCHCPET